MTNDLDRRFLLGGLAGAAGITALSAVARGGPIDPPSGPVGPTGKTIAESEPRIAVNATNTPGNGSVVFLLNQPGSYYLTGNISVPGTMWGVACNVAGCTLDLNGFAITGTATSRGVSLTDQCSVRNGTLIGHLTAVSSISGSHFALAEDLTISGPQNRGVLFGHNSTVRRCRIIGCNGVAIEFTGDRGLVDDCGINGFGASGGLGGIGGLYVNTSSLVRACHIVGTGYGMYMGALSRAERCTVAQCRSSGIQGGDRSMVDACHVTDTGVSGTGGAAGVGVDLGTGATLVGTTMAGNLIGARLAAGCRAVGCSFDSSTTTAVRVLGSGSMIESCSFTRNNMGVDMTGATGNYVHKCVFLGNTGFVAVNIGGNWYPSVTLGGVNAATNPLASVVS